MDVVNALRKVYLFADLPEAALNLAAQVAESLTLERGDVIAKEGDIGDAMFVIRLGSVRVSKQAGGDEQEVVILGSGSHFGEVALLDDAPRSSTVTANEHCELLVFKTGKLRERIEKNHEVAHALYKALACSLAKRLRQTTDDLGFARHLAKRR